MKYHSILEHLADLEVLLLKRVSGASFNEIFQPSTKPVIGDWSDETNLPIPVKGDITTGKSGVYFVLSEQLDTLYIGKATKGNLHERIWGHLQTPIANNDGWRKYPKNRFNSELVENGFVKIGAIEISPSIASSLVEVYLQTIFFPPLCKQIG